MVEYICHGLPTAVGWGPVYGTKASMTASVPPRAGRREWIGLAVIALPCLLYSMDLTVLNLAVPHISADL
jgi:hypothetical protein